MVKGYIYKYIFPNGKIYIGQTTTSIEERWKEHIRNSKTLQNIMPCDAAIRKYGENNIIIEILQEIEASTKYQLKIKLNELEKEYINQYNSTNRNNGYNILNGGERKLLEEDIIEEACYDIFEKNWKSQIDYIYTILKGIKEKLCISKEKLNKEEAGIWYGYTIIDNIPFIDNMPEYKPTLCGFWKKYNNLYYDIGDFEYDENGELLEPINVQEYMFDKFIIDVIKEHIVPNIMSTIRKKVEKKKKEIFKEYNL